MTEQGYSKLETHGAVRSIKETGEIVILNGLMNTDLKLIILDSLMMDFSIWTLILILPTSPKPLLTKTLQNG
jgi:hypothetical protein